MKRKDFLRASGIFPFIAGGMLKEIHGKPKGPRAVDTPKILGEGVANRSFFYRPENAWAADFIPMYAEGKFQLFYLLDWRNAEKYGEGTPWFRLTTTDFVNFTEHGEVIPRGTKDDQDLYIFTGCAIQAKGKYHIFYTGHNHHIAASGRSMQGIMHAVSDDLQHWKKIPEHTFYSPEGKYEKHDWRDPYVFFNQETNKYNMLLTARFKEGIPRRRGLTILCTSSDLEKWEVEEPFYAPNLYVNHECPDLFKIGDWWYLIFSEYSETVSTRYRMSRSLNGPWLTPEVDTFDGHAFYAAKTAFDGKNRFIFGWNPTRSEDKDNGGWNWGGNLVVHQVDQQPNGELTVQVPVSVRKAFNNRLNQTLRTSSKKVLNNNSEVRISAAGTFDTVVGERMPQTCMISATAAFDKAPKDFGVMIRCSEDLEKSYYIRIEPSRDRLVFDMWPRRVNEQSQMIELERQLNLKPGKPIEMEVFVEGNMGVVYVNKRVAMNFRAYDIPEGNWGFFATDGEVKFRNIELATL